MNGARVHLGGTVATDPRRRQLSDGTVVTSFRLVSTERRRSRAGDWEDGDQAWVTVECWRSLAANVADSLRKGDRVLVAGRLRTRDWEDDHGGRRTTVEVTAESVGPNLADGTAEFTRVNRVESARTMVRTEADELNEQVLLEAERTAAEALADVRAVVAGLRLPGEDDLPAAPPDAPAAGEVPGDELDGEGAREAEPVLAGAAAGAGRVRRRS